MVRFKKIRPRRGSLAVSIIVGSPIAASKRAAALAYRKGSLRHDSRYSAIDISVWLRASKDRANALNRESLYMIPISTSDPPHDRTRRENLRQVRRDPRSESTSALAQLDTRPSLWCNAQSVQAMGHKQAIGVCLG